MKLAFAFVAGMAWLLGPAASAQPIADCNAVASRAVKDWKWSPNLERCAAYGSPAAESALGMIYWSASDEDNCDVKNCKGNPKAFGLDASLPYSELLSRGQRYLESAARKGDAVAQNELGHAYLNGEYGMRKDAVMARPFLEQAANGGDAIAAFNLGRLYLEGLGVAMSEETGERYVRLSIQLGYVVGRCSLEVILDRKKEPGASAEAARLRSVDKKMDLNCESNWIMDGLH